MKLTNAIREELQAKVISKMFDAQKAKLLVEKRQLFEKVIGEMFDVDQVNRYPEGYLPQYKYALVYMPHTRAIDVHFEEYRNAPAKFLDGRRLNIPQDFAKKHEKAFTEIHHREKDLDSAVYAQSKNVSAILASVTTSEKLKQIWPEVAEFIPEPEKKQQTALAPLLSEVNRLLK